jgi:ABC-type branched-subunit amino acid transport system substrate-binding protein
MSAPFTGPAASLGIDMRDGIQAAINEANQTGGVRGHHLRLVALDDGYEPSRTAPNMRRLTDDPHIVAVVGNVGTPTAVAALPIAIQTSTPFVGAFSGAGVLRREPPDRVVVNFRASYAEEIEAMVEALTARAGLKPEEIAFFTQRDAYGDAGYAAGLDALHRRGLKDDSLIANGRYDRNSEAVENALADIISTPAPRVRARAVILIGAYKPCARFIRLAPENGFHPAFLCVSFVGALPLASALSTQGQGVIITEVVPHFDADLPLVRDYHHALTTIDPAPTPGFGSLEGYAAMRMLLLAMNRGRAEAPTRASIIPALEGLGGFDLGLGVALSLSPGEHQACHTVWPTVIRAGRVVPTDWAELFPARSKSP